MDCYEGGLYSLQLNASEKGPQMNTGMGWKTWKIGRQ